MPQTVSDLGRLVKSKYPAYQNVPDDKLGRAVKAKYPGSAYDRFADVPAAAPAVAPAPMVGVDSGSSSVLDPRRAVAQVRSPDQPINPFSRREPAAPESPPNYLARGFTGTIYGGNVAAVGGTVEAMGQATGIGPVQRAGVAMRQHGERFNTAPPPPDIFQFSLDDPNARQKVTDYLSYQIGSGVASSAPSIAGAVAGGALTGGNPMGALAGAAIPAYALNTGSIMQEIEKIGGGTPAGRARIALLIGLPVSGLDVLSPLDFAGNVTRFMLRQGAKKAAGGLLARAGKAAVSGAIKEGGTEGLQEGIQALGVGAATGKPPTGEELFQRTASATVGGAVTGGVLGGSTGALPSGSAPVAAPVPPKQLISPRIPLPARNLRVPNDGPKLLPPPSEPSGGRPPGPLVPGGDPTGDGKYGRLPIRLPESLDRPRPAPGDPGSKAVEATRLTPAQIDALATRLRESPDAAATSKRSPEQFEVDQKRVARSGAIAAALEQQIAAAPNDARVGQWKNKLANVRSLALAEEIRTLHKGDRRAVIARSKSAPVSKATPAVAPVTEKPVTPVSAPLSTPLSTGPAGEVGATEQKPAGRAEQTTGPKASAPERPRMILPGGMQFGDEASAQRVAMSIARSEPGSAPTLVHSKKGWEIEINADVGQSRLKKVAPQPKPVQPKAATPAPAPKPDPKSTAEPAPVAPEAAETIAKGARFTAGGREFEVWSNRQGTVIAHPVVDGKPVVNNESGQRFAATPEAQARNPGDRTDIDGSGKKAAAPAVDKRAAPEPAPVAPAGVPEPGSGKGAAVAPEDAMRALEAVRDRKPRPLKKMFGLSPTEENVARHAELMRDWSREYARANKAFRAAEAKGGAIGYGTAEAGARRKASEAAFKRLREKDRPLVDAWLKFTTEGQTKGKDFLTALYKNTAFRADYDAVQNSTTVTAKAKAIKALLAKGTTTDEIFAHYAPKKDAAAKPAKPTQTSANPLELGNLGEGGFINLTDLRDAIEIAKRKLAGKARRDPVAKQARNPKPVYPKPPAVVLEIIEAIKNIKPIKVEQAKMKHEELGRRVKAARAASKGLTGEAAHIAERSELKGEFDKPEFESIRAAFSQAKIDELIQMIRKHPGLDFFEHGNAVDGLNKLLGAAGAQIPQPKELELLTIVFGEEFVQAVAKMTPRQWSFLSRLLALGNVSRAMVTGFDYGFLLRQGLVFAPRHPKIWARAARESMKYWDSQDAYNYGMDAIYKHENAPLYRQMGIRLTRPGSILSAQDEAYLDAQILYNLPIVKGIRRFDRAMSGFMNKLRTDVANYLIDLAKANGHTMEETARTRKRADGTLQKITVGEMIGGLVNAGTGTANSKFIEKNGALLNWIFYSARLIKARMHMLNPANYVRGPKFLRIEYLKTMGALAGSIGLILMLAEWSGAEVEKKRLNNPDFLKIRAGGITYDILGGLVQYARFYAAFTSAVWDVMRGQGGRVSPAELLNRFAGYKLTPFAEIVNDYMKGWELRDGKKHKLSAADLPRRVFSAFVPLLIDDFFEVLKADPWQLPIAIPASIVGVGVQAYDKKAEKRPQRPTPPRRPAPPQRPAYQSP